MPKETMKFTKGVWMASFVMGLAMTYILSIAPTPMLVSAPGVEEFGIPAPVLVSRVGPLGGSGEMILIGLAVDILFWFVMALGTLAYAAERLQKTT
jgi:hypothetical protein